MATKKSSSRARGRGRSEPARAEDNEAMKGSNVLTGAVYHGGRMYDHRKAKDQRDFAALVERGNLAEPAETDPKKRGEQHKARLQSLADAGALRGFGTKAPSKKAKDESEVEDDGTETHPSAADARREAGEDVE